MDSKNRLAQLLKGDTHAPMVESDSINVNQPTSTQIKASDASISIDMGGDMYGGSNEIVAQVSDINDDIFRDSTSIKNPQDPSYSAPQQPPTVNTMSSLSMGEQKPQFSQEVATPKPLKTAVNYNLLINEGNNNTPQYQPEDDYINKIKMMDTVSLRKEVLSEQIEIQKTLLESEKILRDGITSFRDLIAPSAINIKTGNLEIGTKLSRTFFILAYPRVIASGWLEGIVNIDIPLDLAIHINPKDSGEILKELKKKVGRTQAALAENQERGAARDPALETGYQDLETLRDQIQQGVERFFQVGVYITVYAEDMDKLEKYSQTVEAVLSQQSIITKRAALQMDDGFGATLPILKDNLNVLNNLNTSPLSASFPFVSADLSSNSGILYGVNRHNSSLVIFDRFELENANSLVFATSGAGKSYAVKLEILRSLMMGVSVIVVDPEAEYKNLSDTLGGAYINMSLNSDNRINPFDLPKALPGENKADIIRTAIIDLMGLMGLMIGKMTTEESATMEKALSETYARRDITTSSDFNNITPPTMSDLVEILNGIEGGVQLGQKLYRFTDGTFAGIFNQRTNININNQLIVYNIRDLQETLRPIAMYILLKHVWSEIRSDLKKRILAVDEAWIMMQYEDSAKFLLGLVKRARKYFLGVTCITQDVGDFLNSEYGKPIVNNSALKLLLKQSPSTIDAIANVFALTTGEKQILTNCGIGEGIFFAGPRHVAIQILAFPTEHTIITTNPKEVLKQEQQSQ